MCRASAPGVAQVARRYGDRVTFVSMAGLDSRNAMQAFVDEFHLDFPTTVSENGSLWGRFGVIAQAEWLFVDASGGTRVVPYDLTASELTAQIEQVLH